MVALGPERSSTPTSFHSMSNLPSTLVHIFGIALSIAIVYGILLFALICAVVVVAALKITGEWYGREKGNH